MSSNTSLPTFSYSFPHSKSIIRSDINGSPSVLYLDLSKLVSSCQLACKVSSDYFHTAPYIKFLTLSVFELTSNKILKYFKRKRVSPPFYNALSHTVAILMSYIASIEVTLSTCVFYLMKNLCIERLSFHLSVIISSS